VVVASPLLISKSQNDARLRELAILDGVVGLPAQIAIRKGPERETVGVKWWILLKIFFFLLA